MLSVVSLSAMLEKACSYEAVLLYATCYPAFEALMRALLARRRPKPHKGVRRHLDS